MKNNTISTKSRKAKQVEYVVRVWKQICQKQIDSTHETYNLEIRNYSSSRYAGKSQVLFTFMKWCLYFKVQLKFEIQLFKAAKYIGKTNEAVKACHF